MPSLADLVAPVIWTCSALSALAFLAGLPEVRRTARVAGALLLLVGAIALVVALAHPALLPARSAAMHRDGTTDDPRVPATLLLLAAAAIGLLPAWRRLRLGAAASLGLLLPGTVVAGLLGSVASFAHLQQPMALAGIALAALAGTTSLLLAFRARGTDGAPLAAQVLATCLLGLTGMLSLHGARLGSMRIAEGAVVDTLGQRLVFAGVDVPRHDVRALRIVLAAGRDSLRLRPELRGPAGGAVVSVADGRLVSGPIVVPIALEERRARPHDIQWLDRATPLAVGDATIRLAGFRFERGDTIRLYADLDVTTPEGRERVSPGLFATRQGEIPFAARARGVGPIAVARVDADHGRVGLMLAQLAAGGVQRIATLDLRLRPALPLAWAGAALALIAFVVGLVRPAPERTRS